MYKVDFHTHSHASPDGGIKLKTYRQMLDLGTLQSIAVTDHNEIDEAVKLKAELGDGIIIGEEIKTTEGELIGLFLSKRIRPGLTAAKTAQEIKDQGGLVYVPHPFELTRQSITIQTLESIKSLVDIVEVYNGRSVFPGNARKALRWARSSSKAIAASSDAHGKAGLGLTYTLIGSKPTSTNLVSQLGQARFETNRPRLRGLLAPKANRIKKRFSRQKNVK